ncbi:hypothetical protein [Promicromonospora sp. NPDC023805]|uniref:hypothetical protein n=1 Tax=Promicromonospora sp. NPDC023805 TaxID=3154696 RepID=UPI0033E1D5E6
MPSASSSPRPMEVAYCTTAVAPVSRTADVTSTLAANAAGHGPDLVGRRGNVVDLPPNT